MLFFNTISKRLVNILAGGCCGLVLSRLINAAKHALIPLLCGMLVYRDFTSIVTMVAFGGIVSCSISEMNWFVSFRYDFNMYPERFRIKCSAQITQLLIAQVYNECLKLK